MCQTATVACFCLLSFSSLSPSSYSIFLTDHFQVPLTRASIMCEKILIASDAIYAIKRRKSVPTDRRCNESTSFRKKTESITLYCTDVV